MRIAIFGGSFDPVHSEHIRLVRAAQKYLGLDKVIVIPSYVAPHKAGGAAADGQKRLEMCKIAFRKLKFVEVSDIELKAGGTSYSYLTCREIRRLNPDADLFFLMGADMFANFPRWKNPEDILTNVKLAVCGREEGVSEQAKRVFSERFGADYEEIPFTGGAVSSTRLRVAVAFGMRPKELDKKVYSYIRKNGLYGYSAITAALKLEKPSRRQHSFRVAVMACERARSLGIPEEQALLAAALHDCGKYVSLTSDLLVEFDPPLDVPTPVMHQFTGAHIAEHIFGIKDADILNAIRYHTSGREGMSQLETLIYLCDLLESERDFAGIAKLREIFKTDLDACLQCSLAVQIDYLRASGKEIYPLTQRAYEWAKEPKQLKMNLS